MEYKGKLYGRLKNKYFDTGKTSDDYDALEKKVIELENKLHQLSNRNLNAYGEPSYRKDSNS